MYQPREEGWHSGESTRLPPMWPGFDSQTLVICGLSLLLVLVSAPRVFLWVLWFSSHHKNQHFQIPIRTGNSGENSHTVDSTEIPIYLFYLLYAMIFQWNLICGKEYYASLAQSVLFIGWIPGAVIIGRLSDKFGRKHVLFPAVLFVAATSFASSFVSVLW